MYSEILVLILALKLIGILCAVFAVVVFHLTIHELAHTLAGVLCGFQFVHVRVSLAVVTNTAHGWVAGVHWKPGALLTGEAYSLPLTAHRLLLKAFLFIAAGPLANLLTGIAGLVLASTQTGGSRALLVLFSLAAFWVCISSFVLNKIVIGGTSLASDGARLRSFLSREKREAELRIWRHATGLGSLLTGCPASSSGLDRDDLISSPESSPFAIFLAGMLSAENGDLPAARRLMERAINGPADQQQPRQMAAHQLAILEAFAGDPTRARLLLHWGPETKASTDAYGLAYAIILEAEGNREASIEALARWKAYIGTLGRRARFFTGNADWAARELCRRQARPPVSDASAVGI